MKFLLLINSLQGGGAERVVQTFSKYLIENNYEVIIITLYNKPIEYEFNKKIKILSLDLKWDVLLPTKLFKFRKILNDEKPDVVLSFLVKANFLNVLSKLYKNDVPTIISERSMSLFHYGSNWIGTILKKLIKYLYSKADGIIAVSEGVKQSLIQLGVKNERIQVIYNPQPIEIIQKKMVEKPETIVNFNKPTIVTMGRLVPSKGHTTLIKAFKLIKQEIDCQLLIIGKGPEKLNLEELSKSLNIEKDVIFLGHLENPFPILFNCDLFIFTSVYEAFGNALVEAMICGLPIISTDCQSGPREILKGGECGILVPLNDEKKLAEAAVRLFLNQNISEHYKVKSKERILDFEMKKICKQYLEFISQVNKDRKIRN